MKLLGKVRKKTFFPLCVVTSLIFLLVAPSFGTGVMHVTSASTLTPASPGPPESWVNITITPTPVSANPGDMFTLDINVVNVTNLNAYDIELEWPLELLNCTDVQEGPFLKNGGLTFFTSARNNEEVPPNLLAGSLLIGGTPQNGSGILANATFKVVGTGNGTLNLLNTELADQLINPIDHMEIDGYFYTGFPKVAPLYVAPYYGNFYTPNPTQAGHPVVGETLTFNGSGCYDPDHAYDPTPGDIASYKWDFGDGNITTVADPIITHVYSIEGVYWLNLTITDDEGDTDWEYADIEVKLHDIAITNVTVSSTEVQTGDNVYINVTVLNEGSTTDGFNVTAYYIGFDVGTMNTTTEKSLIAGQNTTLTLQWNTTGIVLGTYTLFAKASLVDPTDIDVSIADLEEDKADNTMFGDNITVTGIPVHDVAITQVTVEPTQLGIGTTSKIKVKVKNEGNTAETAVKVNVTARNDSGIVLQLQQQRDLTAGSSQTLSFTWFTGNETTQEGSYNITVIVPQISGETDIGDNTHQVNVTILMLPVANFTYSPSEPYVGGTVTLNASSSYAPGTPALGEPAGTIVTYAWSFGDGNITTVSNPVVTHIYKATGAYSVSVTVTDNDDLTNSYDRQLTVLLKDIVVTSVTFSPNSVIAGEVVSINVTVENIGDFNASSISVEPHFSTTPIDSRVISDFEPGAKTTLQFSWDTTGVPDGIYNILAHASEVQGEANTENNRRVGGIITIEKVTLKMSLHPAATTIGGTTVINGSIETAQGPLVEANVAIWVKPSEGDWSILATVAADTNGQYTTEWTPLESGSYAVKATWPGETSLAASDVYPISVQEAPVVDIFLYTTVGLGATLIALAILTVYLTRIKKQT